MNVDELKSLLSRFGIRPKHRLGQNFLLNETVLDKMVEAAELKPDDTVLEVGPGLGALSRKLAERAGLVLAIEKDRRLVMALRKFFKNKKNVKIIAGDALFFNPNSELRTPNYKLVANIPYYLTGQLLQNFLTPTKSRSTPTQSPPYQGGEEEGVARPSLMVLLLQKEVAERITAKPGHHSILSITTQFYADPEIIMYVPKEDFYPVPEVDSAIVKLQVRDKPLFDLDDKKFFQLVKIGFSSKRKQLHNNLAVITQEPKNLRTKEHWKDTLSELGINPQARAQDLSLEDWKKLYDKLYVLYDL